MSSNRSVEHFLDIVENIAQIAKYVGTMSRAQFDADVRSRDAVERCLMRLSEAAVRLGGEAERLCPNQPWRDIRGLGNHLRHAYDRIDVDEVWTIIKRDLPALERESREAIEQLHGR
jgi:uncharacterized protein with HEPN domain